MGLFRSRKPKLTREQSLASYPVVNQLVKYEELENGETRLQIPRRNTGYVRLLAKIMKLPRYRNLVLDELGTFVIKLCDGEHTVKQIIDLFSGKYKLNAREAEVSMIQYFKMLTQRGILLLAVPVEKDAPGDKPATDETDETGKAPKGGRNSGWKARKGKRRKKR